MFARLIPLIFAAVLFIASLFTSVASADSVIRVRTAGLTVAQGANGTTWALAYKYLQDAIAGAHALNPQSTNKIQIWVAGGSYQPDQGNTQSANDRSAFFAMESWVEWYAGFAPDGSINTFDLRNIRLHPVTLSGDLAHDDNPSDEGTLDDNSYHIIKAIGANSSSKIDGFHIMSGYSEDEGSGGGADRQVGSALVIRNGGSPNFVGANPWVVRCTFFNNRGFRGGAVYISSLANSGGNFQDCTFILNKASEVDEDSGLGGAVLIQDESHTLEEVLVANGATPKFVNCVFDRNSAENSGGAVYAGPLSQPSFVNCTIAGNSAQIGGGGLYHEDAYNCGDPGNTLGKLVLNNSILWGNSCGECSSAYHQLFGSRVLDHCDVDGLSSLPGGCETTGQANFDSDPMFVNASTGDYRLRCASACIDKAPNNSTIPQDTQNLDQDSDFNERVPDRAIRARVVTISNSSLPVDIGAYERQDDGCDADVNNSGLVNIDDLVLVITHWGTCGAPCPEDIVPVCNLNGTVDIDDLVAVITNWGQECITGETQGAGSFSSVQDCIDAATLEYTPHSEEWNTFVQKCVHALCYQHIIECDE